ncbi:MAG: ATP-sensitive inward rectifier potassium channel 10 [Myxococcaceae bacterium]|nr:MAG: ATP-sensitive inward rectifier potassium channel 10 [Myxococcaceae bacterium]
MKVPPSARHLTLGSAYRRLLSAPPGVVLAVIAGLFLAVNLVFAVLYLTVGGIAHARPGSFADAFFFSVQTLATIGYGEMHPVSLVANLIVTIEALLGPILTVMGTGLVFARASAVHPRVAFARVAVVTPLEGVPTLMVRVRSEQWSSIAGALVRLTLIRTERDAEGQTLHRMRDLALTRELSPLSAGELTMIHSINASSPLHGATPGSLRASGAELFATVVGIDGPTGQLVQAGHRYTTHDILFGRRFVSRVTELPGPRMRLDLQGFDEVGPDSARS